MSERPSPNVAASLLSIHQIITRSLDVSIEGASSFSEQGPADAARREGFLNYLRAFCSVLHSHHLAEDELAFPDFQDRLPELPVNLLTGQHQEMTAYLAHIQDIVEALAQEQGGGWADLEEQLQQLKALWHPHIGIEQTHFDPEKIGQMLSAEEHLRLIQRYAQHSQEHSGPPYLTIPFMLYNLPPVPRAIMAQGMPPEVTNHLIPVVWKDQWASMTPFLLD